MRRRRTGFFVPDPSSQEACTIGGNIPENAGGPHCLAYGVTTNHVLGLQVVLPDGQVIETGGQALDAPGYDLTGPLVGSEGTLGIVTQIIVRLVPLSEAVRTILAVYPDVETASNAVSAIIAAGTVPAAMEMMDNTAIQAVEAARHAGYPLDAGNAIIAECIRAGGSITGERGVGIEKRDLMPLLFSQTDLQTMALIRGVFDSRNLSNPCKMFPSTQMCIKVSTRRLAAIKKPIRLGGRELESMAGRPIP